MNCRRTSWLRFRRSIGPSRLVLNKEAMMVDIHDLDVQYVVNNDGEKTAVILSFERFQELLEDIEDLAAVAERREEPTVSHSDVLAELKRDGLLQD